MFTLDEIKTAADIVYRHMPPTPQFAWPLLKRRAGFDIVVKHENATPIGAFKIRGGLIYMERLARERRDGVKGVISATRGNHGQSLALAGAIYGVPVTIVAPVGNSPGKNAAMRAFGADLVEYGRDFDEARLHAMGLAETYALEYVPSFHPDLVKGVATYALELFTAEPRLDRVYAPIGLGSGICGLVLVRDLMDLDTKIVAVVAARADAAARSIEGGRIVKAASASTFADGIATRMPDPVAFSIYKDGTSHVVRVYDDEIAEAIRIYQSDTHHLAEGAGAAALAAALKEREEIFGARTGVILSGANIDRPALETVLAGSTPRVGPSALLADPANVG
jgi:threonine dehydratase